MRGLRILPDYTLEKDFGRITIKRQEDGTFSVHLNQDAMQDFGIKYDYTLKNAKELQKVLKILAGKGYRQIRAVPTG